MSNHTASLKDQLRFPAWMPSEVKEALLSSPLSVPAIALLIEIVEQDSDALEIEGGYAGLSLRVWGNENYGRAIENLLIELSKVRLLLRNFGGVEGFTLELGPVVCWAWSPAHNGQPEYLWLGSPLSRFSPPKYRGVQS